MCDGCFNFATSSKKLIELEEQKIKEEINELWEQ
jgi:hypothetical protein